MLKKAFMTSFAAANLLVCAEATSLKPIDGSKVDKEKQSTSAKSKTQSTELHAQMLNQIFTRFEADLSLILPLLIADNLNGTKDDPANARNINESLIAPREVKIGDAKLFIFGDFIGKQILRAEDQEE